MEEATHNSTPAPLPSAELIEKILFLIEEWN